MAVNGQPPVFELALQGWRYALAAIHKMPGVIGVATLLLLALSAATLPFLPGPKEEPSVVFQVTDFVVGIAQGFLLTPVAIAMHRFVLLGEVTQRYALTPSDPRFKQFFIWTVVFQFLLGGPNLLISMIGKAGYGTNAALSATLVLLMFAVVAALRMLVLFPAIAVDAPGASWQNAAADTRGHTWRALFLVLLTSIPTIAAGLLLYILWIRPHGPDIAQGVVLAVVQSVLGVLSVCALAAVASRLFVAFASRLNTPFSRPARGPGG